MSSLLTAMDSLSLSSPNSLFKPRYSTSSPNSSTSTSSNTSSSTETSTPPSHSQPLPPNSLETHFGKAYSKSKSTSTHPTPRLHPFFHRPPLLQTPLQNRILIYYGSFNPPHIAHLNLLRQIYTKASLAYNIVAAIISPRSDAFCSSKFADREGTSQLYTIEERTQMWERDFEIPEWACVIESEVVDSEAFGWEVRESGKEAGFELRFVSVIGPDYASLAGGGVYDYGEEVMFSDTGRPVDFVAADGLLVTLPGCTAWEEVPVRDQNRICEARWREVFREKSQEYVRGYLAAGEEGGAEPCSLDGMVGYAAGRAYIEGLETAREGLPAVMRRYKKCKDYANGYTDGLKIPQGNDGQTDVWKVKESSDTDTKSPAPKKFDANAMYTCRRKDKTDNVIFIPTTEDSSYRHYISSTDIRVMMSKNESNPKEITAEMASLVLGPHRKPQKMFPKPQTRAERISKSLYESSIFAH